MVFGMQGVLEWVRGHEGVVLGLGGLSLVVFVGTLLIVPLLVIGLPADYFVGGRRYDHGPSFRHPALRLAALIAKNLIGITLILAGLVMLVLPGQGLITSFAGMTLIDFPGKFQLEKRIARVSLILSSMNWIRSRWGKPALRVAPESPRRKKNNT